MGPWAPEDSLKLALTQLERVQYVIGKALLDGVVFSALQGLFPGGAQSVYEKGFLPLTFPFNLASSAANPETSSQALVAVPWNSWSQDDLDVALMDSLSAGFGWDLSGGQWGAGKTVAGNPYHPDWLWGGLDHPEVPNSWETWLRDYIKPVTVTWGISEDKRNVRSIKVGLVSAFTWARMHMDIPIMKYGQASIAPEAVKSELLETAGLGGAHVGLWVSKRILALPLLAAVDKVWWQLVWHYDNFCDVPLVGGRTTAELSDSLAGGGWLRTDDTKLQWTHQAHGYKSNDISLGSIGKEEGVPASLDYVKMSARPADFGVCGLVCDSERYISLLAARVVALWDRLLAHVCIGDAVCWTSYPFGGPTEECEQNTYSLEIGIECCAKAGKPLVEIFLSKKPGISSVSVECHHGLLDPSPDESESYSVDVWKRLVKGSEVLAGIAQGSSVSAWDFFVRHTESVDLSDSFLASAPGGSEQYWNYRLWRGRWELPDDIPPLQLEWGEKQAGVVNFVDGFAPIAASTHAQELQNHGGDVGRMFWLQCSSSKFKFGQLGKLPFYFIGGGVDTTFFLYSTREGQRDWRTVDMAALECFWQWGGNGQLQGEEVIPVPIEASPTTGVVALFGEPGKEWGRLCFSVGLWDGSPGLLVRSTWIRTHTLAASASFGAAIAEPVE